MLQIWRKLFFFKNEMEAKPPTHHKKGFTSIKKSVNLWPGPSKDHKISNYINSDNRAPQVSCINATL